MSKKPKREKKDSGVPISWWIVGILGIAVGGFLQGAMQDAPVLTNQMGYFIVGMLLVAGVYSLIKVVVRLVRNLTRRRDVE
ncbi:MAG: hypothetical protein R3C52_13745 [Hyphomonadaceae bacterium]